MENSMQAVVRKWGNSLALRLPQHVAADLHLSEGATVTLTVEDGKLTIRPGRKQFRLADLLAGMKRGRKRKEIEWGRPQGKEVW